MSEDPERAVVRAALEAVRSGDSDRFAEIVRLFQRRLFGLALMITRDPSGAEEIAQDTFVRAFVHLDAYDRHRPFYPWFSTIAVRLAQNWLVKRARRPLDVSSSPVLAGVAAPTTDPALLGVALWLFLIGLFAPLRPRDRR